jgi:hypothetical protein
LGGNSFAYALKANAARGEPAHRICPNCYENRIKSILQFKFAYSGERNIFVRPASTNLNLGIASLRNIEVRHDHAATTEAQRTTWPDEEMRTGSALLLVTTFVLGAAASAKEGAPDEPASRPKPVTTTIIKRCPDGYELVIRTGGRWGCAKDIVPPND